MMKDMQQRLWSPVSLTIAVLLVYVGVVLIAAQGDPFAFVRVGAKYSSAHAVDAEGYDGQFVYFIAQDPDPQRAAPYLDVPAYRYQRILLPLIARVLSLGIPGALPWLLILIGLGSHAGGVYFTARLLEERGVSRWFALIYGLYAGFLLAVRLDLPEPLAYFLIAAGLYAGRRRPWLQWLLFGAAVFAKEVAMLFVVAQLVNELHQKRRFRFAGLLIMGVLPFTAFQIWLFMQFGEPGVGSGGAMATPFEWVPFMGWFRIMPFSPLLFALYGLIVVPFFFWPASWSIWQSIRQAGRKWHPDAAYLFFNAVVIPFLPFSTVREPGGLLRFGCGFLLAYLLFAASQNRRRALRYAWIVLALSVITLNA